MNYKRIPSSAAAFLRRAAEKNKKALTAVSLPLAALGLAALLFPGPGGEAISAPDYADPSVQAALTEPSEAEETVEEHGRIPSYFSRAEDRGAEETHTVPEPETTPETIPETAAPLPETEEVTEPGPVPETVPVTEAETAAPETVLETTAKEEKTKKPVVPPPAAEEEDYVYVIYPQEIIPLSRSRQEYAISVAKEYDLPVELLYAIMDHESHFRDDVVSRTNDYGIMQINRGNAKMLKKRLGVTDIAEYKQNVRSGAYILSLCKKEYAQINMLLMCYNRGIDGAELAFEEGTYTDSYSKSIVSQMQEYYDYRNAHLL